MGDFQADTLRDSIESGWSLTGALGKISTTIMKNPVKFFAHPQVKQIQTKKAIQVIKNTPLSNDTVHQKFTEVRDVFEIKCRYTVEDVKNSKWDVAETRIEDMCDEVTRIIKTVYSPNSGTGVFYTSNFAWTNDDEIDSISQVLIRTLMLTLTRIKSEQTTVFKGYGGVLSFDTSASNGDDKPASDYVYTEAYDVQWVGGFKQIPELIDENSNGEHVPIWFTGGYSGRFNCKINIKKEDWTDSGTEQIKSIGNVLNSGEVADVVFLWAVTDTEGTPATLTNSIPMRIISTEPLYDLENVGKVLLIGQITKPPTMVIS